MNSDVRSAFDILGCEHSANLDECKQAYRDLVQVWHPDKYIHNSRLQNKATEEIKRINAAWDVIQNWIIEQKNIEQRLQKAKEEEIRRYQQQTEQKRYEDRTREQQSEWNRRVQKKRDEEEWREFVANAAEAREQNCHKEVRGLRPKQREEAKAHNNGMVFGVILFCLCLLISSVSDIPLVFIIFICIPIVLLIGWANKQGTPRS